MKNKIILHLMAISVMLMASCAHKSLNEPTPIKVGDKIPTFSVVTTDNAEYTQDTFIGAGEPFAILVTKPGCPYCQQRLKQLKDVLPEYYPILALSTGDKDSTLKEFEEIGISMPVTAPADNHLIHKFTQTVVPVLVIFNENGIVLNRIEREELTNDQLLYYLTVKEPKKTTNSQK